MHGEFNACESLSTCSRSVPNTLRDRSSCKGARGGKEGKERLRVRHLLAINGLLGCSSYW